MFTKTHTRIALAAAATVFSLAAHAANSILFDPFGTSGASAKYEVDSLDWLPGNALAIAALSTPALGSAAFTALGLTPQPGQRVGESYFNTVAQGKLNSFHDAVTENDESVLSARFGREFTFQTSFYEFATAIGSATASFRQAPGASYFRIFADTLSDSNTTTGAGYGNGTLIFQGTLTEVSGAFTTKTFIPTDPNFNSYKKLDSFNSDQQNDVQSVIGQGSNRITVSNITVDSRYFLTNVTNYIDTTNLTTPFEQTNPSDRVVGVTPSYSLRAGKQTNGEACPTGTGKDENGNVIARCDFHFQSDASGSFLAPEPGSIALIGIALAGLGFANRKRKSV